MKKIKSFYNVQKKNSFILNKKDGDIKAIESTFGLKNKYLKFKKLELRYSKKVIKSIPSFMNLKIFFFKKMSVLSKILLTLKNYSKLKIKNFSKDVDNNSVGDSFKFFKKFLNLNFYRFWIVRYKLLNFFFFKVVENIKRNRLFRNLSEARKYKKEVNKKIKRHKKKRKKFKKKIRKF